MFSPFDSPDTYPATFEEALKDLRSYFEGAGMRVDTRARCRGMHNLRLIEAAFKERERFKGDVAGDY